MKLAEAKLLCKNGVLKKAAIYVTSENCCFLDVEINGKWERIERQRNKMAEYKTIDAAVNAAKVIGFKSVVIDLPKDVSYTVNGLKPSMWNTVEIECETE